MNKELKNFINQIKNMKRDRLIIWIMCFLFLLMGFFLVSGMDDAKECLGNPFIYGARNIINEETGNLHCSCTFESHNYAPFYFNNESLEIREG